LEFKNAGTNTLNLSGLTFTSGITFTFTNGTTLGPGAFLVLVRNAALFATRYPGVPVGGQFAGGLANGGETLTLSHPTGTPLLSVHYDDHAPRPVAADAFGFSLVPRLVNANPAPDNPSNWRASAAIGGSPATDDPDTSIAPVRINEVLSHSETGSDFIELFNPTTESVDIGGWFLT